MRGKYYDSRHRDHKQRSSLWRRIKRLREDLTKLPLAQLNRVVGLDKEGRTIKREDAHKEAYHLADILSNYTGLAGSLLQENERLWKVNTDLEGAIESLEKRIKETTGRDLSVKIEPGIIYELPPHELYLTDQFVCPRCGKPGLPLKWNGHWFWCHFTESPDFQELPRVRVHQIKKGGLGSWWEKSFSLPGYENCFLYGGRASKILAPWLLAEGHKWQQGLTVGRWNPKTKKWEGEIEEKNQDS